MNVKRIAMWSGPRNLSTALMRSFASRNDCSVVDEPFYAAYLKVSGKEHPMRDLILKTYNVDPERVSLDCASGGAITKLQYQKHMTHHMLDMFDRSFIYSVDNAFLIRSPEKVIRSFGKKIINFSLVDLGYKQQLDLFNMICDKTGTVPPVVDADDLCSSPEIILKNLCKKLGIRYSHKMLSWKAGPHSYDGVWGRYWYKSVNKSCGFSFKEDYFEELSSSQSSLIKESSQYFEQLNQYKIIV